MILRNRLQELRIAFTFCRVSELCAHTLEFCKDQILVWENLLSEYTSDETCYLLMKRLNEPSMALFPEENMRWQSPFTTKKGKIDRIPMLRQHVKPKPGAKPSDMDLDAN